MLDFKQALGDVTRVVRTTEFPRYDSAETNHPQVSDNICCYERRRWRRQETEITLTASVTAGAVYRGFCRDISDHGTAALIWGELNVGDEVCLAYRLSGSLGLVEISAVVRYRVGFRYGLEFYARQALTAHASFQKLFASIPEFQLRN